MPRNFIYDVYLAGPFFTDEQKEIMDRAKRILTYRRAVVADPRDFSPIISDMAEKATPDFCKEVYDGNIYAMENSASCFANIDFKDTGTSFELGWFACAKRPIFTFSFKGTEANVMLAQAAKGHFSSAVFLDEFVWDAEQLIREQTLQTIGNFSKAEADE